MQAIYGVAQEKIPIDSLQSFIIEDSIVSQFQIENQFLEVQNTEFGVVLYEPYKSIIQLNENSDTLRELDGFEFYNWKIVSRDTISNDSIKMKGICTPAWGENYAVFTFINRAPFFKIYSRVIFNQQGEELMRFEKVITEKTNVMQFVCFKEPTPYLPGTELPFIELDLDHIVIARKTDFEKYEP